LLKAILFDLGDTLVPVESEGKTMPHALDILKQLRSKFKLAVICNATTATLERVREILKDVGILDFFDAVVVSTDVGCSKPDERIFRIALEKLGVEPNEAIMVGNRISTDILGGNKTGMKTVLLKWSRKHEEEVTCELERPSYTIRSLEELMPIVREIEGNPL
jgi:putative hydrolase of the HAD superfamily